ncbi:SDR family oxidoreductase [Spirosoma daeguense]
MSGKKVSIIGLGWLGLPLAERLVREGFSVKGSVTSAEKAASIANKGIDTYQLLLNPEPIGNLESLLQADLVVINIPPRAGKQGDDFHPQQIRFLVDAIEKSAVREVIFISSTSVYAERNANEADHYARETDELTPENSPAPGIVKAEELIKQLEPRKLVTIVRSGGLLGYDRIPGKYVSGRTVDNGAIPVNYLHRDDAVGLLTVLIQKPLAGTFNAVSPEHPTREAIYRKTCTDFGYDTPTFIKPEIALPYKIISTEKLTAAVNYVFKYSDPLQFFYQK